MQPRISVVIPTYNAAAYLAEAIESVRAQSRTVFELIVVDDCSTDGSATMAADLGALVWSTGKNSGPSVARNIGWRAAQGELVAFLDADDVWDPEHCEVLHALLDRFPTCDVAFSQVRSFGDRVEEKRADIPDSEPIQAIGRLLRSNVITQSAVMVRRSALEAVGGYNETLRFSEDYDLWLRLARRAPLVGTHRITGSYRVHPAQATTAAERLMESGWRIRRRFVRESGLLADKDQGARIAESLRLAFEEDLRDLWHLGHRHAFDVVLAQADELPLLRGRRRRWEWRARLLWGPAHALRRLKRRIIR